MTTKIEKNVKAEDYYSPLLDDLLASIDPVESAKIETRMVIACKIADALTEKKMSKKDLAQQLGQHTSTITKWLSGKHDFKTETLISLGRVLNIDFFAQEIIPTQVAKKYAVPTLQRTAFA
jgi:ribosome-binding protein aMBF1 (putative translation factor)